MKPTTHHLFPWIVVRVHLVLLVVLAVAVFKVLRHPLPHPSHQPVAEALLAPTGSLPIPAMNSPPATPVSNPDFQRRPFPVAYESTKDQWTQADGKDTNVIRQLAHNPLEYDRMVGENDRIKRRQLVYRKEPITVTIDRARNAGEPMRSFTLPGLDGQEYNVEVTQNSVERERMAGSLAGHLKDRLNSTVSIGFSEGYESFNIISPDDGIYIVADAREPGEVMLKEVDPNKYGVPPQTGQPDYIITK